MPRHAPALRSLAAPRLLAVSVVLATAALSVGGCASDDGATDDDATAPSDSEVQASSDALVIGDTYQKCKKPLGVFHTKHDLIGEIQLRRGRYFYYRFQHMKGPHSNINITRDYFGHKETWHSKDSLVTGAPWRRLPVGWSRPSAARGMKYKVEFVFDQGTWVGDSKCTKTLYGPRVPG